MTSQPVSDTLARIARAPCGTRRRFTAGCEPRPNLSYTSGRAPRRRRPDAARRRRRLRDAPGAGHTVRTCGQRQPQEPDLLVRLALVVRRDRSRPLPSRHAPRRPLPHRRTAGPRRDGRSVPRRRPEARPAGRAEVPAARRRSRSGAADAAAHRSADGAPGLAPERLPRLRHRRGRRPHLPVDGVRGRRGSRLAAAPRRTVSRKIARSRSRGRCAPGSPPRTSAASSIATSSRPT